MSAEGERRSEQPRPRIAPHLDYSLQEALDLHRYILPPLRCALTFSSARFISSPSYFEPSPELPDLRRSNLSSTSFTNLFTCLSEEAAAGAAPVGDEVLPGAAAPLVVEAEVLREVAGEALAQEEGAAVGEDTVLPRVRLSGCRRWEASSTP